MTQNESGAELCGSTTVFSEKINFVFYSNKFMKKKYISTPVLHVVECKMHCNFYPGGGGSTHFPFYCLCHWYTRHFTSFRCNLFIVYTIFSLPFFLCATGKCLTIEGRPYTRVLHATESTFICKELRQIV